MRGIEIRWERLAFSDLGCAAPPTENGGGVSPTVIEAAVAGKLTVAVAIAPVADHATRNSRRSIKSAPNDRLLVRADPTIQIYSICSLGRKRAVVVDEPGKNARHFMTNAPCRRLSHAGRMMEEIEE